MLPPIIVSEEHDNARWAVVNDIPVILIGRAVLSGYPGLRKGVGWVSTDLVIIKSGQHLFNHIGRINAVVCCYARDRQLPAPLAGALAQSPPDIETGAAGDGWIG